MIWLTLPAILHIQWELICKPILCSSSAMVMCGGGEDNMPLMWVIQVMMTPILLFFFIAIFAWVRDYCKAIRVLTDHVPWANCLLQPHVFNILDWLQRWLHQTLHRAVCKVWRKTTNEFLLNYSAEKSFGILAPSLKLRRHLTSGTQCYHPVLTLQFWGWLVWNKDFMVLFNYMTPNLHLSVIHYTFHS